MTAKSRPTRLFWLILGILCLVATACASSSALPETASQAEQPPVTDDPDPEPDQPDTTTSVVDESSSDDGEPSSDEDAQQAEDSADLETEVAGEAEAELAQFSTLCNADPAVPGSRVDVNSDGNRVAPGSLDFAAVEELEVELPDTGVWVTADPAVSGGWFVVLERGSAVRVSPEGVVTSTSDPSATPPELDADGNPQTPFRFHELFQDPIDDGRVVFAEDIAVVLSTPTDIYPHGVLGDELEAAAIEWVDVCTGEGGQIDIPAPDVVEGLSPLLADIDNDGQIEIVVTLANADTGARLAAFELDGTTAGESEPIGQGRRWRNQLAATAFGPDGGIEIVDVRTPHIGGTVQSFRQVQDEENGPQLVQVAVSDPRYTSHVIGTRNLSMGIAIDANADDWPDVLVATSDRDALVGLTRTSDLDADLQGWNIIGERELQNALTSNIAAQEPTPGSASIAIADGDILRIWS